MKRVLLVMIPFYLLLITGDIIIGVKYVFNNADYKIPHNVEKFNIEYSDSSTIKITYNTECTMCGKYHREKEYKVSSSQLERINKERVICINNAEIHPWRTFCYGISSIAIIVWIVFSIYSTNCCFLGRRRDSFDPIDISCCYYCKKQCDFYNRLNRYNLEPAKKKFFAFWGY